MESARIVAGVARVVRDVGLAEELAHDALVAAMEQWPRDGVPDNPGAWLAATARRRAIDVIRREQNLARKTELLRRARARRAGGGRGGRGRGGGGGRRRPRAALRHLPPGGRPRVPGRAHPAAVRRPDHRRDRPRVPRPVADDRAADLAGEEAAGRRGARRPGRARRRRARRPPGRGARGDLPRVQRGLRRDHRRRLDAPVPVRRGDAPGPRPRRRWLPRSPRCTGSWRSWSCRPRACGRASGRRGSRCCWATRTARAGTACCSGVVWPRWPAPRRTGGGGATCCRRRSPRATPAPGPPTTPTGRRSRPSTASSRRSPRPR